MKRNQARFSSANPFVVWHQLAFQTGEMLVASAQVISHRTRRIVMAGALPNARDRREFTLMGQEKVEAASESLQAIAARMIAMNAQLSALAFRQMLSGMMSMLASPAVAMSAKGQADLLQAAIRNSTRLVTQFSGSMARVAHHGLRPIHSRATGNAKRLLKYQ